MVALVLRRVLFVVDVPHTVIDDFNRTFGNYYEFSSSKSKQEAIQLAADAEILVMIAPNRDVISSAKKCRWIHALTAGVERFLEVDSIRDNESMLLTNSSGIHGIPMSEHLFAMLLVLARRMRPTILKQQESKWEQPFDVGSPDIFELHGSTMGIIGLGHIGMEIAKRAKSFGMEVIGTKTNPASLNDQSFAQYVDEVYPPSGLDTVLKRSDVVVNILPLTASTRKLFGKEHFSKFKQGSIFVNIGRGETVVESDLVEALDSKRLRFAALDVFDKEPLPPESPLWKMESVLVSPHYAGWSPNYFERAYRILEENLRRYSSGEKLVNLVDRSRGY